MSSIYNGLRLLAKMSEWIFRSYNAPTHFIFEPEAMRETAAHERGVPKSRRIVVPLGVDTKQLFQRRLAGTLIGHLTSPSIERSVSSQNTRRSEKASGF